MRAKRGPSALGLLAMLGGCALPPPATGNAALDAPVAADLLAFLAADTCRQAFAGADPVPYHAGAPATALADGSYEICYQQRPDGRWSPRAAGRLLARIDPGTASGAMVRYEQAAGLTGSRIAGAEVTVRVVGGRSSATLHATTSGTEAAELLAHLRELATFCGGLGGQSPPTACCAHHAPWRALPFLHQAAAARRQGSLIVSRDALRAAKALHPGCPGIDFCIGELDRALGQDELAVARLLFASRTARDPSLRAAAAAGAVASSRRLHGDAVGPTLRSDAQASLDRGDLAVATALAQQARALDPEPLADLHLRHRLMRAREDWSGSLGTMLLLREYAPGPVADRLLAEDLGNTGQWPLARRAAARLIGRGLPAEALVRALRACGGDRFAEAWIGWAEAVGALAVPLR